MSKKNIERICKNCKLYDPSKGLCAVVVLHEGERIRLPVEGKDACFFEQQYFDPTTKAMEDFNHIEQVRFWVEDKEGKKTDGNGTVKIEYPEDFFGGPTLGEMMGMK